jgi:uncharacterized protein DUF1942
MRKVGVVATAAATTMTAMTGLGDPASASAADECMHQFGSHQRLTDAGGAVVQDWTVTDLKKSTDPATGYPLAGQLWEATASVQAVSGTVTPMIPNFHAPTVDGASYPVLWQLSSPQGIPGATIAQGQTSTGKVYFDATGTAPAAVVYTGAGAQPLMWMSDAMMNMMMNMPMDNCMNM